jgi:hypothetical protein
VSSEGCEQTGSGGHSKTGTIFDFVYDWVFFSGIEIVCTRGILKRQRSKTIKEWLPH